MLKNNFSLHLILKKISQKYNDHADIYMYTPSIPSIFVETLNNEIKQANDNIARKLTMME